ncbi:SLATT domain-containing protein [Phycicoccus sp. Soil803]|uniref:SLATT domain-containing protein n=1 Tax=Phycicoccus sp. Soil803 TaxID=1736415 RepID=UPI000708D4D5|nr:SLATT domain-containing protein [Phycicoccus sp. Soil803]KRF23787.1 hypothetical protein ASG95_03690 [Phycicoccus sp. Soil803]
MKKDKFVNRQIGEQPTVPLVSGLSELELASLVRGRLYGDKDYARSRRTEWRAKATTAWAASTLASAVATVILGLAELGTWASIGFVLSALVTTLNAVEPFFNWRSRWVGAEEALHNWHRIEESLALYVARTPADQVSTEHILEFDDARQRIWDDFSGEWLAARRNKPS